jgi:hypothetical protein
MRNVGKSHDNSKIEKSCDKLRQDGQSWDIPDALLLVVYLASFHA